jgi:hypothetical protein
LAVVADLFGVGRHWLSTVNYPAAARFIEWRSIPDVPAVA